MKTRIIPVTPFKQNCTLLICEASQRAAVVDPGGDLEQIEEHIEKAGVTLEKVFLTHGHLDHCGGAQELAHKYHVPIEGPHKEERFWLDLLPEQSIRFGFPPASVFMPDRWLENGDCVHFGEETLEVYHCPGHTPGHIIFFSRAQRLAMVGDVLFAHAIGRTDFPRGNRAQLIHSIQSQLWPLGDDVTFIPGHGRTSTFGQERKTNPYVADEVISSASVN
ncbi:MAG: Glyoxylase, beta-lactamase superfamily II [Glomeribacter sp. 1016415]|nr:Glyoxylase, beta-lactamase superfamily II [Glomeribacter sp. 1016415]